VSVGREDPLDAASAQVLTLSGKRRGEEVEVSIAVDNSAGSAGLDRALDLIEGTIRTELSRRAGQCS
jgi:hypothetical protein